MSEMGDKMESQSNRQLGPGWDRAQMSLRLTPERRAELLALCSGLGPTPTPTDAIDRALEIAKQARQDIGREAASADDIEAAIEARMPALREAIDRQGRDIAQVVTSLRGLHQLMSAIAQEADSDGLQALDDSAAVPLAFRSWLEGAISKAGAKAQRSAVARSTWQRLVRSAARMSCLDLMAELVAVDGALVAASGAYPEMSRIDLIEPTHPICAVELPRPIFLVCQALPNGWIAHAHLATAEGQPGEAIGSHRI